MITLILCFRFHLPVPGGLGKHFSDEGGLSFYYVKIGFLEYLRKSGEIRYSNGPISNKKKQTIWKEANNLERRLYWGCYPRLSGGGSNQIKKVPVLERLPRRFNIVNHR